MEKGLGSYFADRINSPLLLLMLLRFVIIVLQQQQWQQQQQQWQQNRHQAAAWIATLDKAAQWYCHAKFNWLLPSTASKCNTIIM